MDVGNARNMVHLPRKTVCDEAIQDRSPLMTKKQAHRRATQSILGIRQGATKFNISPLVSIFNIYSCFVLILSFVSCILAIVSWQHVTVFCFALFLQGLITKIILSTKYLLRLLNTVKTNTVAAVVVQA